MLPSSLLAFGASFFLASGASGAALLPTEDPFYVQPANISSYPAGAVIRSRSIPDELSGYLVGNETLTVHAAYQYLYRTTNVDGDAVAAITTLLVPNNADASKLVVYQTAYDSTDDNCVPSYSLRAGGNSSSDADVIFIAASLNRGYYVLTSDYEGLSTEFNVGPQAGFATLDSVRAAFAGESLAVSGLQANATRVLFGYSGGSIASEWATELAASYAPELGFAGMAIGGVPANITSTLEVIDSTANAQLSFEAITGVARAYPNLTDYVQQHLLPDKKQRFEQLGFNCMSRGTQAGANESLFAYFDTGRGILTDPVPRSVFENSGIMGLHGTPQIPVFLYKAIGDEIAPVGDTDVLFQTWCERGVTVEYQRNTFGDHATEAILGSATAFSWIVDRLDGVPVANQGKCVESTVNVISLDPGTIGALGQVFIAALQSLLGGPLGPPFPG